MVRASVVVLAVALLFAFATTARADYEEGASAFQSGDYVNALAAWRPLAEEGNARAQFGIAVIFEEGGGVARDFAQAALWYQEAANQGLVDAQFNLGNLYRRGQGVQKDARRAVFWYLKAATQGMAPAQYNLALSYETGSGAAQNYTVAAKWYRMAAEQGDVDAQIGLAGLYRFGLGIEKDIDHARALFEMAAAQGDPRARFHLEAMDAKMAAAPAAPAAPEPVPQVKPEPEPEVTATVATVAPETIVEGFGVQLAAYRRLGGAEEAWRALQADHPDLLSDQDPAFYRTELADGSGDVFRLVAGGFESKVAADDLCRRLKQRGIDCFVPRPRVSALTAYSARRVAPVGR